MRALTKRRARRLAASARLPFPAALLAAVLPSFVLPLLPPYACFTGRPTQQLTRPRTQPTTHARTLTRGQTRNLATGPSRPRNETRMSGATFAPTSTRHRQPEIELSVTEQEIFDILNRVVQDEKLDGLTLRVAGGWVRDKVMGNPTKKADIDIAMDKCKGAEFAEMINSWLTRKGYEARSIGVIQRNPEQSKHLETATMKVQGVELDLVNLRTEEYVANSRIPEMKIGTPEEDALRRDLTINALFYNLNTKQVEDFTGRGLPDIDARIIRTPLEPLTTLLDDPLRALRVIRFAARLNFQMDAALFEACKKPAVHVALKEKVSRERITAEIDGMLRCEHAFHAIGLLIETGLFPIIFELPPEEAYTSDEKRPPKNFEEQALNSVINLCRMWTLDTAKNPNEDNHMVRSIKEPEHPRCARYAALLLPIATVLVKGKKGRLKSAAKHVLTHSLKLSNKDIERVERIHEAARRFKDIVRNPCLNNRLTSGRILRESRLEWRPAVQILLARKMDDIDPPTFGYAGGVSDRFLLFRKEDSNDQLRKYIKFSGTVEGFFLGEVWNWRPLVDGNALFQILPRLPRGPEVGVIQRMQIDWMIENRNANVASITQRLLDSYPDYAPEQ